MLPTRESKSESRMCTEIQKTRENIPEGEVRRWVLSLSRTGGFALLAGDTSVDSWFREIHAPRAWRVYLATGFDFREKKSCFFGVDRSPSLLSVSYLATLLWRKGDEDYFSQKLRVRIKDNKTSPHVKFRRFLFPFSSKFSDLNMMNSVPYLY